jgi:hypothetical protein
VLHDVASPSGRTDRHQQYAQAPAPVPFLCKEGTALSKVSKHRLALCGGMADLSVRSQYAVCATLLPRCLPGGPSRCPCCRARRASLRVVQAPAPPHIIEGGTRKRCACRGTQSLPATWPQRGVDWVSDQGRWDDPNPMLALGIASELIPVCAVQYF